MHETETALGQLFLLTKLWHIWTNGDILGALCCMSLRNLVWGLVIWVTWLGVGSQNWTLFLLTKLWQSWTLVFFDNIFKYLESCTFWKIVDMRGPLWHMPGFLHAWNWNRSWATFLIDQNYDVFGQRMPWLQPCTFVTLVRSTCSIGWCVVDIPCMECILQPFQAYQGSGVPVPLRGYQSSGVSVNFVVLHVPSNVCNECRWLEEAGDR